MKNGFLAIVILGALNLLGCGEASPPAETSAAVPQGSLMACPDANEAGIIDIAPGLTGKITSTGYGRAAMAGDYADVHTTLWLFDENAPGGRGTEIWASGGDRPFQFRLDSGQVIRGWDLGVACMLVGETRELTIPPELGYGARGKPPVPPNATLLFEIELVKLTSSAEPAS